MKTDRFFRVSLVTFTLFVTCFIFTNARGQKVTKAYRDEPSYTAYDFCDKELKNCVGVGDFLWVEVQNLEQLVDKAECKVEKDGVKVDNPDPNCQKQEIVLYINDRRMNGIYAHKTVEGKLLFELKHDNGNDSDYDNNEIWAALMRSNIFQTKIEATVSVGLENGYAIPTDVERDENGNSDFHLVRLPPSWGWWLAGMIILGTAIVWLAFASDMLRDSGPQLPKRKEVKRLPGFFGKSEFRLLRRRTYSLARLQMAWWFFWVVSAFTFILIITWANNTITPGILTLIGISSGTTLGAALIENVSGKRKEQTDKIKAEEARIALLKKSLETEKSQLEARNKELDTEIAKNPANVADLQAEKTKNEGRIAEINNELVNLEDNLKSLYKEIESRNLFLDILSDNTDEGRGISLHRFQMVVWTVVLTFIFITSVAAQLAMPEFNATLLALQGIVAGTYLGFKIPSEQSG